MEWVHTNFPKLWQSTQNSTRQKVTSKLHTHDPPILGADVQSSVTTATEHTRCAPQFFTRAIQRSQSKQNLKETAQSHHRKVA
jgi:hypothetical protein